jgi:hypothetical protein
LVSFLSIHEIFSSRPRQKQGLAGWLALASADRLTAASTPHTHYSKWPVLWHVGSDPRRCFE